MEHEGIAYVKFTKINPQTKVSYEKEVKLKGFQNYQELKNKKKEFVSAGNEVISLIVTDLKHRFSSVLEGDLFNVFQLFDISMLKSSNSDWMEVPLRVLLKFLSEKQRDTLLGVNTGLVAGEFRDVVNLLKSDSFVLVTKVEVVLGKLIADYCSEFSNFIKLAEYFLSWNFSSVSAERGFSALGRVKTKLRNMISTENLEGCMRVMLFAPSHREFCDKELGSIVLEFIRSTNQVDSINQAVLEGSRTSTPPFCFVRSVIDPENSKKVKDWLLNLYSKQSKQ